MAIESLGVWCALVRKTSKIAIVNEDRLRHLNEEPLGVWRRLTLIRPRRDVTFVV